MEQFRSGVDVAMNRWSLDRAGKYSPRDCSLNHKAALFYIERNLPERVHLKRDLSSNEFT